MYALECVCVKVVTPTQEHGKWLDDSPWACALAFKYISKSQYFNKGHTISWTNECISNGKQVCGWFSGNHFKQSVDETSDCNSTSSYCIWIDRLSLRFISVTTVNYRNKSRSDVTDRVLYCTEFSIITFIIHLIICQRQYWKYWLFWPKRWLNLIYNCAHTRGALVLWN